MMFFFQIVLTSMGSGLAMILTGLALFRVPVRGRWPALLLMAVNNMLWSYLLVYVWGWAEAQPILYVLFLSWQAHVLLGVRWLRALLMMFLGALSYTVVLAVVLLGTAYRLGLGFEEAFGASYLELGCKLGASLVCLLLAALMKRYRLGFSLSMAAAGRTGRGSAGDRRLLGALLAALALFAVAYYAVSRHEHWLLGVAAALVLVLSGLLFILYKKEMDEN
ncbi:hypothetical protein B5M42_014540 [Paenibacillus athensensis]|nr:hypothetical protein [Paenibacillus athensensis]MCD1260030.1 hypothetical protein [Paenibacillus athensensis]